MSRIDHMLPQIRARLRRASLLAWLALFALVAVPSVSRALPVLDPLGMAAVCSTGGSGTPADLLHLGEHCGLCGVSAQAVLPPSVADLPERRGAWQQVAWPAPVRRAARIPWPTAPPRAPPVAA